MSIQKEVQVEDIIDNSNWSLFEGDKSFPPLKFTNGKTQADIVQEVQNLIKSGKKVIFIHGVCGTGKSAIALNLARKIGRTSIVVPIKSLQRQYQKDYSDKKYVLKPNGQKLKITIITGRENHDSLIMPGATCADPYLPETIKFTEKNSRRIQEFYKENPHISNKISVNFDKLKRISIAPANPYWSPIYPSDLEVYLPDSKKKKYKGLEGREFTFHHRKTGCTYYDQFDGYINSDVIVFNSAKYKIETDMNRKPATDLEIIDEADEFLDSFSTKQSINLSRLMNSLKAIIYNNLEAEGAAKRIADEIKLEEINKRALGVNENIIFPLTETRVYNIIQHATSNSELEDAILADDQNYSNKLLELALTFKSAINETFVTFRKDEDELIADLVTSNLSKKFNEIVDKNKAVVLMSGTVHSEKIIKEVFGIKDFAFVEAETVFPGTMEILRTGSEKDCSYASFSSKQNSRENYLKSLAECVSKAKPPTLIHVNAFEDLPSNWEVNNLGLSSLISKEDFVSMQDDSSQENAVDNFKKGIIKKLFTTKCSRGADFPGEMCNSIIFTKYPNPNPKDIFWQVLKTNHPNYFWEFYKDKANREFLQKIFRGLRFRDDFVQILSPDTRVLDAVKRIQNSKR